VPQARVGLRHKDSPIAVVKAGGFRPRKASCESWPNEKDYQAAFRCTKCVAYVYLADARPVQIPERFATGSATQVQQTCCQSLVLFLRIEQRRTKSLCRYEGHARFDFPLGFQSRPETGDGVNQSSTVIGWCRSEYLEAQSAARFDHLDRRRKKWLSAGRTANAAAYPVADEVGLNLPNPSVTTFRARITHARCIASWARQPYTA